MEKGKRSSLFSKLYKIFIVLAFALPCGTVIGQDKGDEFTLEEITVTAEFRAKELQDTPLSITAISAETRSA